MIEQFGNGGDLIGFLGHAQLRQREACVGRVGAERVQRLQSFALVACAARGFAIDGDEVVPPRPQRLDPALETAPEQHGIDAVDQSAQPALAGNPVMEGREPAQKVEMMLAPGDDAVKIVAGRDGRAGQKKEHLRQRIHHPPGLALVRERGKMLQKQGHARPRNFLVREKVDGVAHYRRSLCESERRTNHLPCVNAKSALT